MPELPEVETIRNELVHKLLNKELLSILEFRKGTVNWINVPANTLLGTILSIDRRGKYLLIRTSCLLLIVVHLRMTGKLILQTDSVNKGPYTRAIFNLSDQAIIRFDDIRTFGRISVHREGEYPSCLQKLGVEPLSVELTADYLVKRFCFIKSSIYSSLLRQDIIAGLGNIYVCEILFRSAIAPSVPAKELSYERLLRLTHNIIKVINEAIIHNGTTISDYRRIDDKTGEFQNFLQVYQKKVCSCGTMIKRQKIAGRSAYFCPNCQKNIAK